MLALVLFPLVVMVNLVTSPPGKLGAKDPEGAIPVGSAPVVMGKGLSVLKLPTKDPPPYLVGQ